MVYYEIDLSRFIEVTLLDKTVLLPQTRHVTRHIGEYIVYVIERGSLKLLQNGEELLLESGDVCIFEKGEYQEPLGSSECTFYYMHFLTDGFSKTELSEEEYLTLIKNRKAAFAKSNIYGNESYKYIRAMIGRRFNISDKGRLEKLTGLFKENTLSYSLNAPRWRMGVSFAAATILMQLEDICMELSDKGYLGKNGRVYDTAERIAKFIRDHYTENFGSRDIEKELLINFDYANRIFKKNFGYSIIKYRNLLRVNTSKKLMEDMTLDEVAARLGFSDRYYFSRCFKKFEGESPEKYRKRMLYRDEE